MSERELFEVLKKNAIQNILSVSGKQKTTDILNQEFDKIFDVLMSNRKGYKLVPIEPTDEQIEKGRDYECDPFLDSRGIYKAMVGH